MQKRQSQYTKLTQNWKPPKIILWAIFHKYVHIYIIKHIYISQLISYLKYICITHDNVQQSFHFISRDLKTKINKRSLYDWFIRKRNTQEIRYRLTEKLFKNSFLKRQIKGWASALFYHFNNFPRSVKVINVPFLNFLV